MTTVKRITDLSDYTTVLPYASELFGVYQPLLGWKSQRMAARIAEGYRQDRGALIDTLVRQYAPLVDIQYGANQQVSVALKPGVLAGAKLRAFDTVIQSKLAEPLPATPPGDPSVWQTLITRDRVEALLAKDVVAAYVEAYGGLRNTDTPGLAEGLRARASDPSGALARRNAQTGAFEQQLRRESTVSGLILQLVAEKRMERLQELFYVQRDQVKAAQELLRRLDAGDGIAALVNIDTFNPTDREQLAGVVLSPISVVHLFRQYFFELDTFLGTPVSHVWLSPGSSVELVEVQTRRTTTEKTLQSTLETTQKTESSTTTHDELSDAVKEDNDQDIKFGASVKASYASVEATSSFDYANSQKKARETTHKQMREQTDKLSSEIRKNFTSTFKQVTEFTDVSSVKHVMANSTQELINYELRRKMRQVGVQVQDVGTYLCWQTYVDDPGRQLGLAELVHIAKPADLDGIPHPEEIPLLQPFQETKTATIPFISIDDSGADNDGGVFVDGRESDNTDWFDGGIEEIQANFLQEFVPPKANYELTSVEFDPQGKPVTVSRRGVIDNSGGTARFILHLDSADFQGQNSLQVGLTLHWSPGAGANDDIKAKNQSNLAAFKEAERAAYEKAYVETVKERVTLASQITTRNADELRDEERVVVYRKLIQDMLLHGIEFPDDRTRHVTAELLNSIFDVDKMLYFVSPEWWRPRLHRGRQQLQATTAPSHDWAAVAETHTAAALRRGLGGRVVSAEQNAPPSPLASSTVGWGGMGDTLRDNYLITESSAPARLGSSLGWLLQLDGDNMRNAFLNAPWVKAVMPIRPGKEAAAINWLKSVEGMNGITDDVLYHANNPAEVDVNGQPLDGQKLIDVLLDLAEKIKRKYEEGILTGKYPKPSEVSDPQLVDDANTVTATPIDRVYEHGFFPLEGSFRANVGKNYEIFDQWIEILPTDQIVPVEVKYDPRTGRMIFP